MPKNDLVCFSAGRDSSLVLSFKSLTLTRYSSEYFTSYSGLRGGKIWTNTVDDEVDNDGLSSIEMLFSLL